MSRLDDARLRCAEITRSKGPNFSVGFELLPQVKKAAVHACYAFCRLVDDLADEGPLPATGDPLGEWRAELDRAYDGEPRHAVGIALADAARRFPIPREAFLKLIQGCEEDLRFRAPASAADLRRYCDLVATPIGEMSLAIFGATTRRAFDLGRELSHALQLTNILRDVREDVRRGRVYLPVEWLDEAGASPEMLDRDTATPAFVALMQRGLDVARAHYAKARDLPSLVEDDSRAAVRLMAGVYEEILDRIARDPAAVLRGRVGLTESEKAELVRRLAPEAFAGRG
jgi:phytoene synthase